MEKENTEDVKIEAEDSSPPAEEQIPKGWSADLDETQESEEVESQEEAPEDEAQEDAVAEAEPEEVKPERKVPLPALIKERKKRQELERELNQLKVQPKPQATPKSAQPTRPKLKDFEYNEESHEAALENWEDERLNAKVLELQETRDAQQTALAETAKKKELESTWEEFVAKDAEYADLVQEVFESEEDVNMPPVVIQAIQEYGFELDKHILQNRDTLLPKLRNMTPLQQSIEVGRILSSIESKPAPKPKPKSNAPKPIKVGTPAKTVEDPIPDGWVTS